MTEIKDKIIDGFEATRESPRDFFEPESLVQYLLKKPKEKNGIHNSFKGKRKLGNFLKELEAKKSDIFFAMQKNTPLFTSANAGV